MTKQITKFLSAAAIAIAFALPVSAAGVGCVDTVGALVLEKPIRGSTGVQVFGCFDRTLDTLSSGAASTSSVQAQFDAVAVDTTTLGVRLDQVAIDTTTLGVALAQVGIDTAALQVQLDSVAVDTTAIAAAKVDRAGDTMTGNLTISNTAPELHLLDTDATGVILRNDGTSLDVRNNSLGNSHHLLNAGGGNSYLQVQGGNLSVGSVASVAKLYVDQNHATEPALRLDVTGGALALDVNGNQENSGVILAADGTAGAPAYSFTNDTDAGLFQSGGSTMLGVNAGDTEVDLSDGTITFDVDADGSNSPNQTGLSYNGGGAQRLNVDLAGRFTFGNNANQNSFPGGSKIILGEATPDSAEHLVFYVAGTGSSRIHFKGEEDATTEGAIEYDQSSDDMTFYSSGTASVTIDGDGNMGVGTTAPTSDVDILKATAELRLRDTSATGSPRVGLYQDTVERAFIEYEHGVGTNFDSDSSIFIKPNNTTAMKIESGGNVGIGTEAPASPSGFTKTLDISGLDSSLVLESSLSGVKFEIGSNSDGNLQISSGPTTLIVVSSAGRTGMGTAAPESLLHLRESDQSEVVLRIEDASSNRKPRLEFKTPAGTWGLQTSAGDGSMLEVRNLSDEMISEWDDTTGNFIHQGDYEATASTPAIRLTNVDSAANRFAEIRVDNDPGMEAILVAGVNNGGGVKDLLVLRGNANEVGLGLEATRSTFTAAGNLEVPGYLRSQTAAAEYIEIDMVNSNLAKIQTNSQATDLEIIHGGNVTALFDGGTGEVNVGLSATRSTFTAAGNLDVASDINVGGGDIVTTNSTLDIDAGGASSELRLRTNGQVALTVGSGGNVMIATSSNFGAPLSVAEVGGSSRFIDLRTPAANANRRNWGLAMGCGADGDFCLRSSPNAGGDPFLGDRRMTITRTGDTGFGTASPMVELELNKALPRFRLDDNDDAGSDARGYVELVDSADATRWRMGSIADGNLKLDPAGNDIFLGGDVIAGATAVTNDGPLSMRTSGDNEGIVLRESYSGNQSVFAVLQNPTDGGGSTLSMQGGTSGSNQIVFDSSPTANSYFNTGGNIGFGTATPVAPVQINNGNEGIEFEPAVATDQGRILFYDRTAGAFNTGSYDALAHVFRISGSDKFTIESDGDVVISSDTLSIHGVAYNYPDTQGTLNQTLVNDGSGNLSWSSAGGGGGHQIADASGLFTQRSTITFGPGISVTDDAANDSTDVNIGLGNGQFNIAIASKVVDQAYTTARSVVTGSTVTLTVYEGSRVEFTMKGCVSGGVPHTARFRVDRDGDAFLAGALDEAKCAMSSSNLLENCAFTTVSGPLAAGTYTFYVSVIGSASGTIDADNIPFEFTVKELAVKTPAISVPASSGTWLTGQTFTNTVPACLDASTVTLEMNGGNLQIEFAGSAVSSVDNDNVGLSVLVNGAFPGLLGDGNPITFHRFSNNKDVNLSFSYTTEETYSGTTTVCLAAEREGSGTAGVCTDSTLDPRCRFSAKEIRNVAGSGDVASNGDTTFTGSNTFEGPKDFGIYISSASTSGTGTASASCDSATEDVALSASCNCQPSDSLQKCEPSFSGGWPGRPLGFVATCSGTGITEVYTYCMKNMVWPTAVE